ncbi:unnamed protein product [Urochloa decumbens]|uniref:Ubiquitin-like protease family profile domain-containing protein n=1 Tax=Urochloa decumbens TaxID=240449 RepID=A0ABC8VU11_9POAL
MGRKRPRERSPEFETGSDSSDSIDEFEVDTHQVDEVMSDAAVLESDDLSSSDDDISEKLMYKHVLDKYRKLSKMKRDLKRKLLLQSMRNKHVQNKPKETFSRFSVTSFSKVVRAVSGSKRDVIDSYGFGSLLSFDKCFVPWKFATWIAQQVDYKSGDLLFSGQVISLTPASVSSVLGLPVGGLPFPTDINAGKSIILETFNKQSLPSVMFFVDKLTEELDTLSDEQIFISFLLVALNTFLCPNSSQIPSQKYLGIFADISIAKQFDWCGYILSWLFQHIRTFNRGKSGNVKEQGTLGGCLYYLAVLYLDFVDFGPRNVPHDIPRICVWKQNMIQSYCQLDMKSKGCYGLRPKLSFSETCYAKNPGLLNCPPPLVLDNDFMDKLDSVSRCKLPADLKISICSIIQKHTLNSGVSVQMDLTAISVLPRSVHEILTKLLQHASSVDFRSKKLVLEIMKVITEYPHDDEEPVPSDVQHPEATNVNSAGTSADHGQDDGPLSERNSFHANTSPISSPQVAQVANEDFSPSEIVPSQYKLVSAKLNHYGDENCKQNSTLTNESPATPSGLSKRVVLPVDSCPPRSGPQPLIKKTKSRFIASSAIASQSNMALLRKPLCDISNLDVDVPESSHRNKVKPPRQSEPAKDVIMLLDEDDSFVPDSLSPRRPSYVHLIDEKSTQDSEKENFSTQLTQRFASSASATKRKETPDIQIVAQKSLSQSTRDMTKIADDIYNKKFCTKPVIESSDPTCDLTSAFQCSPCTYPEPKLPYVPRDSSTGGKLPPHGPRRAIKPAPLFQGDYETEKHRISLSASDLKNYKAICSLANCDSNRDDVLVLGKVRCTFWAFGDSLKPDGFVNSFVMSAYCYSLFLKPPCQSEQSKAHYFFANIGAELMKDPEECNQDVLSRAFKISHRSRPLDRCNNLFFPILFSNHWTVFVVSIKDQKFVFLDSLHHKDHEYQEIVRESVVPSFMLHWDKYVKVPMDFDEYSFLYPEMPQQAIENRVDSGIYAMMCLQYWKSPRTVLSKFFDSRDVPRIRIKVANDLLRMPENTGLKDRVFDFQS